MPHIVRRTSNQGSVPSRRSASDRAPAITCSGHKSIAQRLHADGAGRLIRALRRFPPLLANRGFLARILDGIQHRADVGLMRHLTPGIKPSREAADACQLSAQKPMRIASGARQRLGRQVTFPMDEKTPFSKQSAETPY